MHFYLINYILYPWKKKNRRNRGAAILGRGLLWTWLVVVIGMRIKYSCIMCRFFFCLFLPFIIIIFLNHNFWAVQDYEKIIL